MRRRRRTVKVYSIAYLLSKQPKSLSRHHLYSQMLSHYRTSPRLQQLRMTRRCYSLLQHAVIKPEYLQNFYRTYRLPKDPFFPIFLRIKRDYMADRERKRRQKIEYIGTKMRELPPQPLTFIKYLAAFEEQYNGAGAFPVWTRHMFPRTKKRVREYAAFSQAEWIAHFEAHMQRLQQRYRRLDAHSAERVIAAYVLDCLPQNGNAAAGRLDPQLAIRNYRRLSKLHHPDLGGDGNLFLQLQRAREVLSER